MEARVAVFALAAFLILSPRAGSAAFTNTSITGLPAVHNSTTAWADYDNDGLLDFIIAGITNAATGGKITELWRNTGDSFTNVPISNLPAVHNGTVAWADYNNDGMVDFLLTGTTNINTSGAIAQLWQNTGEGFINVTTTVVPGLPGVRFSSVAWGDYDHDGRLDFLINGLKADLTSVSQLWRNTGDIFTNVPITDLPQVGKGSLAWAAFDNDGRLDFLITGTTNDFTPAISQLWRNTGAGFTNVTTSLASGLPGVAFGSVAWGDYDNDSDLDFLITGTTNVNFPHPVAQLWQNTGTGFSNVTLVLAPDLPQVWRSAIAWGDFDNDGRLDLLITGTTNATASSGMIAQLWRNTAGGFTNFTSAFAPDLPGVLRGSVSWGDADNDGRLDLLITGYPGIPQFWRNYATNPNTPPAAPTGLAMTASSNAVMLSWHSATDGQTPTTGLTYNVRAGTTPGGIDLLAAEVDPATGFRRVPALGNAMLRRSLPLTGLTNGQTVYWSVQAVDTAYAGGPFASETSVVSMPRLSITPLSSTNATVNWTPPTWGWRLQESTNFVTGPWGNAPSAELNPASVFATNAARYYRLVSP
jgi:hypothetical protein